MTHSVLVVVPAHNEQTTIAKVVSDVLEQGYDCLVVDDGSEDRTGHLASAAGAKVLTLPINLGVGGALRAGWRFAIERGYDVAVQVDGDGQHLPSEIPKLVSTLHSENFDLIVGTRFAPGGTYVKVPIVRRSAIRLLQFLLEKRAKIAISDPTSGFRAIRRPLLDQFARNFPPNYLGDTFEALLVTGRRGYRVGELPVEMRARQGGVPSASHISSAKSMIRALLLIVLGASFDIEPREL